MATPTQIVTNFPTPLNSTCTLLLGDAEGYCIIATCTGTPPTTASTFQHGAIMIRTDSGTGTIGTYENTGSIAVPDWNLLATSIGGSATSLVDSNEVTALDVGTTASAVNNLRVTDSAANRAPILSTVGASTNPGLQIWGKGSGVVAIGTASAVGVRTLQDINYVATSGSSANTLVGTLTDANGVAIPLAAGLKIRVKTDTTLQKGANTINLNGGGAKNIIQNSNGLTLNTTYASGAILDLAYDGTSWQYQK
jgi:hypothetical protein